VKLAFLLASIVLAAASGAAPGDQYFGTLKMSTLRIRYEIVSVRDRYETHRLLPEQAMHLALLDQNAFDDWSRKYPHDDWLASTAYLFAKLYEELPGHDAQTQAVHLLTYIKTEFPKTHYATQSRNDLHRGVPVRPDPAWAAALRAAQAATPSPSPSASASPATSPQASSSPSS